MAGTNNKPLAKIVAKAKDAPRGTKAIPVLALWPGQYGVRASLESTVAKIVMADGTEILPGRDGKFWLNAWINEAIPKDQTREERDQAKKDEPLVDKYDDYGGAGGDDNIPFAAREGWGA